jgi:lipooligosaccharide transport system permease protein
MAGTTRPATAPFHHGRADVLELAWRQLDYLLTVYKRTWKGSVVSSFLMPVLYLLAMGVGLGGFIDDGSARTALGGVRYIEFIAPGLLVATAMQTAVGESTYPVMGGFKWTKVYHSQVATPLTPASVLLASLTYVVFRLTTTCAVFVLVLAAFGLVPGVGAAVGALLVAVLVGMAYATPVFAYSARLEGPAGFAPIFRLGIMPMFLFSGAFFEVSQLPDAIEWVAYLNPLWHAVELARMLSIHPFVAGTATLHLVYLGLLVVVGWWLALRGFTRRLVG